MPAIPLIWRRVDTIHHCLGKLALTNREIRAELAELAELESNGRESNKYRRMRSAFVRFDTHSAEYMACETLLNANPLQLSARHVGIPVRELRWSTLPQRWNRYTRNGLVWIAIASLLIIWAIPVALMGILSQIATLADSRSWLHWKSGAPAWLSGIIQGVLPQLILVILTTLMPLLLRARYHSLARSVNGDDSRAVAAAEILLRLSLRAKLSHSVAFIQYCGHRS